MTSSDQRLTSTICGTITDGRYYTSSSNTLRVRFYTDPSISGSGFSLVYNAVDRMFHMYYSGLFEQMVNQIQTL